MVRTKRLAKDDYPHNKLVREQAKIDAERRAVREKSWYSELDADARPVVEPSGCGTDSPVRWYEGGRAPDQNLTVCRGGKQ